MKSKLHFLLFSIIFINFGSISAQNVTLYNQFNGRYDFKFIGNTMNLGENNTTVGCESLLLTSSSANLNLTPNQVLEKAYLYWAGSGNGDFNVQLNGNNVIAERTFSNISLVSGLPFFSAFTDVTPLVQLIGNNNYTLSNLDISQTLINEIGYCTNRTNFAGWALVLIYKDLSLPLNQINIYDGLQSIPNDLTITLNSLNVVDNIGAKIGFIAWEGDSGLAVNETLQINNSILSNPPLNPANNAFNGTNSFTGSTTLYNMDLDVYDIQNNIGIGDTSAQIKFTSGQDVVLINTIITKLNSQLPDATIKIDNVVQQCNSRTINVNFTVSNFNATTLLLSGTPIAIYANNQLINFTETTVPIVINGSWTSTISLIIPDAIPTNFTLLFVVDDIGNGTGIRTELIENNNTFSQIISFLLSPNVNPLLPINSCNEGLTQGTFNFGIYDQLVLENTSDTFIHYYETNVDANNNTNPILNPTNYIANATPKEIFIRVENENCYTITSFLITTTNCPPTVYNYVSANNDGANDVFFIKGLRDIFLNFELQIYNRWGKLVWTGTNNSPDWDGFSNENFRFDTSNSPKSTYYYILNLNDINYLEPLMGWLYFTK